MNKKIFFALTLLFVLCVLIYFLRTKFTTDSVTSPVPGAGLDQGNDTSSFVQKDFVQLPSIPSKIDCRKPRLARASVGDELNRFWQNTEDEEIETFIHFDSKTRILTVCHKGQATAALLNASSGSTENETVRVSEAQFGDMNADGKNEFLVFQSQCAEAPCAGHYLLMQLDSGSIKKLYTLLAETVEVAKEMGHNGLRLEKFCYTQNGGMGPVYFSVAEFSKDGELSTVAYQELREKFPIAVAQMKPSQSLGFEEDEEPPAQQKAYLKIHDLIVQAYQGKPYEDLLKAYDQITAALPPVKDETSASMRLNLDCEPAEILKLISGK